MIFKSFITVVFTSLGVVENEVDKINILLESGAADYVHVRKPGAESIVYDRILSKVNGSLVDRLVIHDCFSLSEKYPGIGVHLNSRNPSLPPGVSHFTKSFHSLEEVVSDEGYRYATLSPIYDSISKQGYKSQFDLNSLKPVLSGKNIVALGGVTPMRFDSLVSIGFCGAALLGYVWQNDFNTVVRELIDAKERLRHI